MEGSAPLAGLRGMSKMLTKKDYIKIGNILKLYDDHIKDYLTDDFCKFFKKDNPKFDEKKFREFVWKKQRKNIN